MATTRSVSALTVFCLIVLYLPSTVLNICGFFSPYWVKDSSRFHCNRGLLYNVDCPDDVERLSDVVLGMQAISMILVIIPTIKTAYSFCYAKEDTNEESSCYEHCTVVIDWLYPSAGGILGSISCIIISITYNNDTKGSGFYINLVASCYIILQMYCALNFSNFGIRNDRPTDQRAVQCIDNNGGVVIIGQLARDHEIHVGATSSNGDFAVRKL